MNKVSSGLIKIRGTTTPDRCLLLHLDPMRMSPTRVKVAGLQHAPLPTIVPIHVPRVKMAIYQPFCVPESKLGLPQRLLCQGLPQGLVCLSPMHFLWQLPKWLSELTKPEPVGLKPPEWVQLCWQQPTKPPEGFLFPLLAFSPSSLSLAHSQASRGPPSLLTLSQATRVSLPPPLLTSAKVCPPCLTCRSVSWTVSLLCSASGLILPNCCDSLAACFVFFWFWMPCLLEFMWHADWAK